MRLHELSLQGFRSYEKCALKFDPSMRTLLYGENGTGKTNIIEALSYLSAGRSCLRLPPDTAVRWGETFFRLTAVMATDAGEKKTIEYVFQTSPRRASACFVDDQKTPLVSFIGTLPTIIFLPEHLDLFTGSPQGRRQFLDALLAQLFPDFAAQRLEYDRVLKQRNAELKRISHGEAPETDLDLWDKTLSLAALPILQKRKEILDSLSGALPEQIRHFGETWTEVSLKYLSKAGETEIEMLSALQASRKRDLILETTTVGPHRDDWMMTAETRSLAVFASRGQQRTSLLALLVASVSLFTTYRNETPILLLDDVFSELDIAHQEALTSTLDMAQVIMTSTHDVPEHTTLIQRAMSSEVLVEV